MENETLKRAETWLHAPYDEVTQSQVRALLNSDLRTVEDAFYRDLEFGTGGLRGIMGPGTNRMNIYTLGLATQGFADYLKAAFPNETISVALAHDCRNNSRLFALHCASVFSGNRIRVLLFDSMAPTPALSFAIRHHGCRGGAVITASHNPPEYNGFKVYWDDGAQVVEPHDKGIMERVRAVGSPSNVMTDPDLRLVTEIGPKTDAAYLSCVKALRLSPDTELDKRLQIVYTALHGTGGRLIPRLLREEGYKVSTIEAQDQPDGNFSTVASPNPEEREALEMAIRQAEVTGADLVMGTDPDADRVGIAVRDTKGHFVLLNGNETAVLLVHYMLTRMEAEDKLTGTQFICKTIVTTPLIDEICTHFDVNCYDTLTGFKYIAELIRRKEGKEQYLIGGEESYGYLAGDFVRDKDAVSAAYLIAEMAAHARKNGQTLIDRLCDIRLTYGYRKEHLISITKKGKDGLAEIGAMMEALRKNPPSQIGGSAVSEVKDLLLGSSRNLANGESTRLNLPTSDVLQFITEDDSWVTARPSGTEPKIKFYFSVLSHPRSLAEYAEAEQALNAKINDLAREMGV